VVACRIGGCELRNLIFNMLDYIWRWELSPLQIKLGQTYGPTRPNLRVRESTPFKGDKLPLPGAPGLTYQFGVGDGSVAVEIVELLQVMPDLERTGDRRSGVLVFDGERLVGNWTVSGKRTHPQRALYVDPEYRGRNLGPLMILEWSKRTKRPRKLHAFYINPGSAKALLRCDMALYDWAEAEGKAIPDRALIDRELDYLRTVSDGVIATGDPVTITADMQVR